MAGGPSLGGGGVRLILLGRSLELGGAERQMALLAAGLRQRGHQVTVACFYPRGPLVAELRAAGVEPVGLDKRGRWDLPGPGLALVRLARRHRAQVIYSFLDTPNLLAALVKPLLPGVRLAWGVRASDMDLGRYDWFAALMARLPRLLAGRADLIIANSRAGAAVAGRRGLPAGRLRVIPNGIDTQRFAPDPAAGLALRRQWGVGPEQTLVGLVGRVDPMKDHATFLRAAALMRARRPGLRLVCVGDGPAHQRAALAAQARDLGLEPALVWAGARGDMPAVMNALDLLALSSAFGEGFPNVVGEAMACAVPVVVTRVGDAAWVAGRPELAVAPGDPPALAAAALAVLDLPPGRRRELGRELRRRVEERFSLAAMVEASQAALADLVSPPQAG